MATLDHITIGRDWANVTDGFSMSAGTKYDIQNLGPQDVEFRNVAGTEAPGNDDRGITITPRMLPLPFTQADGETLWARVRHAPFFTAIIAEPN